MVIPVCGLQPMGSKSMTAFDQVSRLSRRRNLACLGSRGFGRGAILGRCRRIERMGLVNRGGHKSRCVGFIGREAVEGGNSSDESWENVGKRNRLTCLMAINPTHRKKDPPIKSKRHRIFGNDVMCARPLRVRGRKTKVGPVDHEGPPELPFESSDARVRLFKRDRLALA